MELTPHDSTVHEDKKRLPVPVNPVGGYSTGRVLAVVGPVCRFDETGKLRQIVIHPAKHLTDNDLNIGLPGLETGEGAREVIEYLAELSAPFGTSIRFADGVGIIDL